MHLESYLDELICPKCHKGLKAESDKLVCMGCNTVFPVKNNIPLFCSEVIGGTDMEKEFNYWNEKNNTTDNLYENMPDEAFNRLITLFNISPNTKGLELGCGDGPFSRRINNTDNFGLDISFPLLNISKNMKAIQGSALELPFADEHFDWVIYAFSLHHMPDPSVALEEAFRVLKKGGRIYIVDPNYYHPIRFLTRKPGTLLRTHVFKYLSPEERWVPVHRIKKAFGAKRVSLVKVRYITPEFNSTSLTGAIQRIVPKILNFWPFNIFVHSYYLVEGRKG